MLMVIVMVNGYDQRLRECLLLGVFIDCYGYGYVYYQELQLSIMIMVRVMIIFMVNDYGQDYGQGYGQS